MTSRVHAGAVNEGRRVLVSLLSDESPNLQLAKLTQIFSKDFFENQRSAIECVSLQKPRVFNANTVSICVFRFRIRVCFSKVNRKSGRRHSLRLELLEWNIDKP